MIGEQQPNISPSFMPGAIACPDEPRANHPSEATPIPAHTLQEGELKHIPPTANTAAVITTPETAAPGRDSPAQNATLAAEPEPGPAAGNNNQASKY